MPATVKTKTFHYTNHTAWVGEKRGILEAEGKPGLAVASPPEFKGHPGIWTPEDFLVAAVNACTMTTFLSFASRQQISLSGYESDATGTLEMQDGKFRFTRFSLRARITVTNPDDRGRAIETFHSAEAACLIANSLTGTVEGEPEVVVQP